MNELTSPMANNKKRPHQEISNYKEEITAEGTKKRKLNGELE